MDDESIIKICTSSFAEEDIVIAKNLLFDSLPKRRRKIIRKKSGKSLRNIDDIVCLLRDTDPEDIPVFVARDLEKLPPVLFDHVDVTRLLKDIVKMQQDINAIKQGYVTMEHLKQFKSEIEIHKSCVQNSDDRNRNVNMKRGTGCLLDSFERHSGPMGLPPVPRADNEQHELYLRNTNYCDIGHEIFSCEGSHNSPHLDFCKQNDVAATTAMTHINESSERPPPPIVSVSDNPRHTAASRSEHCNAQKIKSAADVVKEGEWKQQIHGDDWIKVQRKRLRNRFMGKTGRATIQPGNNFKAAEIKIPIYIYNVSKDVTVCDINDYIKTKTQIDVSIEKMDMKKK
ncbi:hypothetical protein RR46_11552 [Papilio xuthus]|uniref:Uncharacterized protein n=1 Tax=Papilio xuthus TaxID=66420 RepID=A0A194PSV2_PAPXU|nr:hypothetical protein RR46_11552 [Papilio xuthus]